MSDPITMLAALSLAGAVMNTKTRVKELFSERESASSEYRFFDIPTEIPLISGRAPSTSTHLIAAGDFATSPSERAFRSLCRFAASPVIGDGAPAKDALKFLQSIPQNLLSPKVAESETGIITLFWETPAFYGDVEFIGDGTFSVFTRDRDTGRDETLDSQPIDSAGGDWLQNYFSRLLPASIAKAA